MLIIIKQSRLTEQTCILQAANREGADTVAGMGGRGARREATSPCLAATTHLYTVRSPPPPREVGKLTPRRTSTSPLSSLPSTPAKSLRSKAHLSIFANVPASPHLPFALH